MKTVNSMRRMVMKRYGFPTQLCGVAIISHNAGQRKYSIFERLTRRMAFSASPTQ